MKKILVPCDFSDPSVEAFRFAIDIAEQSQGEVILLNVVELPILYDTTLMPALNFEQELLVDMKADAERNLKKMIAKWAKDGPRVKFFVEYGPTTEAINRFAEERKADLIVMGTKGASGVKEFFVGSNTEKVVRKSSVPVIAIKKYKKTSSIRNIVFPNQLSVEQEALTLKVKELQEFFKAKLHIVYVNTPANFHDDLETRHKLKDFTDRFMIKDFTVNVFNDIDQESGVMNFAHETGADMIAMATHGRNGLGHLMSGSVAEDVVNHMDCPIWTSVQK